MSRSLRINISHLPLHVTSRGNNRQTVFRDESDYRYFCRRLQWYKEKYKIKIYHYALMPNHVHLLLESVKSKAVSLFIHDLLTAYSIRFHRKYEYVGHVWQGRFKSKPIEDEVYLLTCGRYIELNAVRAKIAQHPVDYPWSSYHAHTRYCYDSLVDLHPIYLELDQDPVKVREKYKALIENDIEEKSEGLTPELLTPEPQI